MSEVEPNAQYSPSAIKRPSPTSVAEVLGIVQLQQQPSTLAPAPNRKGFSNPLPAIGKSSHEPKLRVAEKDTLSSKGLSRSFPSPRSLENDQVHENGSPRTDDVLSKPRGAKLQGVNGRKDLNQLPPLSSTSTPCDNSIKTPVSRSKTTLTRTFSDGESAQRPRSNSNPRPKSARGQRTRSFHGEASHQRIKAETANNMSPQSQRKDANDLNGQRHVLLAQRRSLDTHSTTTRELRRTQARPSNPSPDGSDSVEGLERPSAPSPPSPGLDSDSESELNEYVANLHV